MHDTWRREERQIDSALEIRASIVWTRGPLITIRARALKGGIIMAQIKTRGGKPDCRIAIQGAKSRAFYNASHQIASRPSIKI